MTKTTDGFFAAWSIVDRAARTEAIELVFNSEFTYADPRTPNSLSNLDALVDYIGAFIEVAPGATAKVIKSDLTNSMQRSTVAFSMANGMVQHGQYFIEFDDDGKIRRMTGFVGTGATE